MLFLLISGMSEFISRVSCLIWNSMIRRTAGDVQDNVLIIGASSGFGALAARALRVRPKSSARFHKIFLRQLSGHPLWRERCRWTPIPSAVSVTPRGLRRISSTPISSSKSFACRLNAGCATRSCAAALVKFDALPAARKYRSCRSSIIAFHYAEKTRQLKE
jgi:hypothetical protein